VYVCVCVLGLDKPQLADQGDEGAAGRALRHD
jgi:hypothetical protein